MKIVAYHHPGPIQWALQLFRVPSDIEEVYEEEKEKLKHTDEGRVIALLVDNEEANTQQLVTLLENYIEDYPHSAYAKHEILLQLGHSHQEFYNKIQELFLDELAYFTSERPYPHQRSMEEVKIILEHLGDLFKEQGKEEELDRLINWAYQRGFFNVLWNLVFLRHDKDIPERSNEENEAFFAYDDWLQESVLEKLFSNIIEQPKDLRLIDIIDIGGVGLKKEKFKEIIRTPEHLNEQDAAWYLYQNISAYDELRDLKSINGLLANLYLACALQRKDQYQLIKRFITTFPKTFHQDLKVFQKPKQIDVWFENDSIYSSETMKEELLDVMEDHDLNTEQFVQEMLEIARTRPKRKKGFEPIHWKLGEKDPLGMLDEEGNFIDPPGTIHREEPKVGRNDPCPCGSGKKYKKCCG